MNSREINVRAALLRVIGGIVAYGCLAAFVCLVGVQTYRWFREGEWPHIGITTGVRAMLVGCCVNEGDTGHLAMLVHWLDTPTDWLGWHKILEVVPASIGLFALSMLGNFAFIYGGDRIHQRDDAKQKIAA
ncbi:MAG: hypothetical protein ACLQJ0_10000 [Steroidobacteraceae bacterium]|jgi:hypothetical protein